MKDLLMFIRRFVRPYRWNVVWSVVFNFLTTFFTLFSFAFIMPILKILFSLDTTRYEYMDWSEGSLQEVILNNFYWQVTRLIDLFGGSATLALLAVMLIPEGNHGLLQRLLHHPAAQWGGARHPQHIIRQDTLAPHRFLHP